MDVWLGNVTKEWDMLLSGTPEAARRHVSLLAQKQAAGLSQAFYQSMFSDPEAEDFLTNEQVETYLKKAFEGWIIQVLSASPGQAEQLVALQRHVGEVHARIGVPVQVVAAGARVLKKAILSLIDTEDDAAGILASARFLINSIDLAVEVMTRVFVFNETRASREEHNFRIFSLLENAEEEKEKQISNLLAWETDVISKVMVDTDPGSIRPFGKSDFGLWFSHKGRYYFSDQPEVGYISKLQLELDELIAGTAGTLRSLVRRPQRVIFMTQVRNILRQIRTHLRAIFDDVSRQETGMDTLTRLLNRRFLPTILKREIGHASRNHSALSLMVIDVDRFKSVNDTWGHFLGDEILRKVAQIFYNNVRSCDYIFRYGGDEFLIVLTEASLPETLKIAERIRQMNSLLNIRTPDDHPLDVTLSIGVAMFDGHPDYERLIKSADDALYRAKVAGRNRVEK